MAGAKISIAGQQVTYDEIQRRLGRLVWDKEDLRAQILKNPKEVIARELGITFSEDLQVKVIDATDPSTVYFIIPRNLKDVYGFELTPDQIDTVMNKGFSYYNEIAPNMPSSPFAFANSYSMPTSNFALYGFGPMGSFVPGSGSVPMSQLPVDYGFGSTTTYEVVPGFYDVEKSGGFWGMTY